MELWNSSVQPLLTRLSESLLALSSLTSCLERGLSAVRPTLSDLLASELSKVEQLPPTSPRQLATTLTRSLVSSTSPALPAARRSRISLVPQPRHKYTRKAVGIVPGKPLL